MLKPKRKITRDEIKKDSFVESVFEVRSFVKENLKLFYQIGGGVALFFLLIIFLGQSSKNNKLEAEFLLTQSTLYLDSGDVQNAKILLQELVDEYDGTEAGRIGGYHLAQIYISDNDNELALPLLIKYSKSGNNQFLLSSSNEAIASMYMQINNLKKAIEYQSSSLKYSNTKKTLAFSKLKLVEMYIKEGSIERSKELIAELKNEYSDDQDINDKIDYVVGLLMNK